MVLWRGTEYIVRILFPPVPVCFWRLRLGAELTIKAGAWPVTSNRSLELNASQISNYRMQRPIVPWFPKSSEVATSPLPQEILPKHLRFDCHRAVSGFFEASCLTLSAFGQASQDGFLEILAHGRTRFRRGIGIKPLPRALIILLAGQYKVVGPLFYGDLLYLTPLRFHHLRYSASTQTDVSMLPSPRRLTHENNIRVLACFAFFSVFLAR